MQFVQAPSRFQLNKAKWQAMAVDCRVCRKNSADETGYWCAKRQLCNHCYRKQSFEIKQITAARYSQQLQITKSISEQRPSAVGPPPYGMIAEVSSGDGSRRSVVGPSDMTDP